MTQTFSAMKQVFLVTAFVSLNATAYAQMPLFIGENANTKTFIDLPTILQDNVAPKIRQETGGGLSPVSQASAWVVAEFKQAQIQGSQTVWSLKLQYEFDCRGDRARIRTVVAMSDHMGTGKVLAKEAKPGEWKPVGHTTDRAAMLNMACGKSLGFLGNLMQPPAQKAAADPKKPEAVAVTPAGRK
ncbi:MAG TPA: surface-adhesin E family protein [Nitrospiraceae bacterium]|nr:surface-adhesin E family protein [Nitrospiraceae bacterium]